MPLAALPLLDAFSALADRTRCRMLWLLDRQCGHRRSEVRDVSARILVASLDGWVDGAGVPWEVGRDQPGLQGTEMWLSITYLAADLLGESDGLSWRPQGVHRLDPANHLGPPATGLG